MAQTQEEKRAAALERNEQFQQLSLEERLLKLYEGGHGNCREAKKLEGLLSATGKFQVGPERASEAERLSDREIRQRTGILRDPDRYRKQQEREGQGKKKRGSHKNRASRSKVQT